MCIRDRCTRNGLETVFSFSRGTKTLYVRWKSGSPRERRMSTPKNAGLCEIQGSRVLRVTTFRARRSREARCILITVCVCLSVPRLISPLLHAFGCNFRNGKGCPPLVVQYSVALQWLTGFCCYGNIHLSLIHI